MDLIPGNKDLSFIDCGIRSLLDIDVESDIVSLTFHSNRIDKICNLHKYYCLRHLDLSSNKISVIEGLENLKSLRTLNLSNNQIQAIPMMRNSLLAKLDVSFNKIKDFSGLISLESLKILFIQGNRLENLEYFLKSLSSLSKLRHLVAKEDGADNPMCNNSQKYSAHVWQLLVHLESLDFTDKFGLKVDVEDVVAPGVDEFLEFLSSQNYSTSDESTGRKVAEKATPVIYHGMDQYLKSQIEVLGKVNPQERTSLPRDNERLENIERQISLLLQHQAQQQDRSDTKRIREIVSSTTDETLETSEQTVPKRQPETNPRRKGAAPPALKRNDQQTVASLVKEVEFEKKKRWKAEENVTELKTSVVNLKSQLNEFKLKEESLNQTIQDLKDALTEEQKKNERLSNSVKEDKRNVEAKLALVEESKREKQILQQELQSKKDRITELENSMLSANAKDAKKDQEASRQLRTLAKEFEKLQDFSKTQINKVKALEAELEDKQDLLKQRFALDSKEVKEMIAEKVKDFENLKNKELDTLSSKLQESYDQYKELEDEFRMALYSEEARYNEVSQNYVQCEQKLKDARGSCESLKQKHEKSSKLVHELSNVVKEQKGRLTELQKVKQDLQSELKSKAKIYEEQIESFREKVKELDALRNDKKKLAAHIQAQDSIIEGLRKERKMWEAELAKQGTSLAADRGRMEVRIEQLERELAAERKSVENDRDSLKIKSKVIEDQTDTIKKLKDAILERDSTIVKTREDSLKERKELERQLEEETKLRQDIQEEIALSTERKHALKEDIEALRSELEEKTFAYEELLKKWKQKSALIGQLEVQVKEKKSEWDKRESELIKERDSAVSAATSAVERLKETEFKLESELRETREKFERERMELVSSCDERIEEVENEMREMLKDHEKYKKTMDAKFNKLHSAISDFQTNV